MMIQQTHKQSAMDIHTPVILVVEDDDSIGMILVEALAQETPYNAVLVTDGFQALQMVDRIQPCLLITDYRLPVMNGLELYDLLKSRQIAQDTPTILISAQMPEQEVRKRNIVALHKPFELDDLLDTVERLLVA